MDNLLALSIGNGTYTVEGPSQLPKGGIFDTLIPAIGSLIVILLIIVIVASLFMIILSGIQWSSSGGDEKNLEKAKGRLKYSIIGLIVALLSFFIIQFIARFFGLPSLLIFSF